MNSKGYVSPFINHRLNSTSFTCPHCGVYCLHTAEALKTYKFSGITAGSNPILGNFRLNQENTLVATSCSGCNYSTLWTTNYIDESPVILTPVDHKASLVNRPAFDFSKLSTKLLYPSMSINQLPTSEMPEDVKELYEEAREIAQLSPRAATALLRLATERLTKHLGASSNNLNQAIQELIDNKVLPPRFANACDALRITGNEAIHITGEINPNENPDVTIHMFGLVNRIVEHCITAVKKEDEYFNNLPIEKLKGIEHRGTSRKEK